MANEVESYVGTLEEPDRSRIVEIYSDARKLVPEAADGISYGMPCLVYKGKGLIAVMSTKNHIGIYPFGNLAELSDAATSAGLETTKGSLHLHAGQRVPSDLLEQLLLRRVTQIDEA
jgi:uncharacterized protein YdhG (YjbR/CyaY superfamily)